MAKVVKFLKGGSSRPVFTLGQIADEGVITAASATSVTVEDSSGGRMVFHGDFTVNGLQVTGGTVTGFDLFSGATKVMKGKGYATSVTDVVAAFDDGMIGMVKLLLSHAKIKGSPQRDIIYAGAGSKVLGGDGKDYLTAIEGKVVLKGGDGGDVLWGSGASRLVGEAGDDTFYFDKAGADRVVDFSVKNDVVAISGGLFAPGVDGGFLSKAQFRIGGAAETPAEIVLYARKSGALKVDEDGSGPLPAVQIGFLPDHLPLKAGHIMIEA